MLLIIILYKTILSYYVHTIYTVNQENNWRFMNLKMCVKPVKWMLFGFLLLCDRECLERHYLRCSRCSFISQCAIKIVWLCWLCKYRSVSISALFQFSLLLLYAVSLKVDLPQKTNSTRHVCAAFRPLELIAAVRDNACDSTRCATAHFRSVPEATLRSGPRRIRASSIFNGSHVNLHRAARARQDSCTGMS